MTEQRTVHASSADAEIVRYDRAGKWYLEPKAAGTPRRHIRVNEAARLALGMFWHKGRPGGQVFDAKVARARGLR